MKNRFSSRTFIGFFLILAMVFGFVGQAAAQDAPETASPEMQAAVQASLQALQQGKMEEAINLLQAESSKNPELPPAQLLLASICLQTNNGRPARILIEQAVKNIPGDPEAYIILARLNLQNGNITEANLLFLQANAILAKFTGNEKRKQNMQLAINVGLAQVNVARENYRQAIALLTTVLSADRENQGAWELLGMVYFQDGNVTNAAKSFAQLKALNPQSLQAEARIAALYQQKGDDAKMREYLASALRAAPSDVNVHLVAAQLMMQTKNVAQAAQYADRAVQLDASNLGALLLRGTIAMFQDQYTIAETNFKKAFDISSSNFQAVNGLAMSMSAQTDAQGKPIADKMKKAEEYAVMNLRAFDKNPTAYATAAWVLYNKGDYPSALQRLQEAMQLANRQLSEDSAFFLAAIWSKAGNDEQKKQAKEILSKLVESDAQFMMRKKAEDLNRTL